MRRSGLAWLIAGIALALGVWRLGLVMDDTGAPPEIAGVQKPESSFAGVLFEGLVATVFTAIGALVAARRPRNPIGWLLLTTGVSFAVFLFAERLGWHWLIADGEVTTRVAVSLWVANWGWIPAIVPLVVFVPLLFPTGAPASARWRRFTWAVLFLAVLFTATSWIMEGALENYTAVDNPLGISPAARTIQSIVFPLLGISAIAAVTSLALRFRRSQGVERQQIKWVWAGGAVLVVTFVATALLEDVAPDAAGIVQLTGLLAVPAAIAVAILRYRLYDIAVVVNRTLVYGSLTALLALVYLGSVLLLQLVLDPVTSGSSLAIAVSTLAVAGLFGPVRARIQRLVDRRFYRRKYDTARTLEAFSARLRDEVDLDSLARELRDVLQDTMQPAHVSVWLKP